MTCISGNKTSKPIIDFDCYSDSNRYQIYFSESGLYHNKREYIDLSKYARDSEFVSYDKILLSGKTSKIINFTGDSSLISIFTGLESFGYNIIDENHVFDHPIRYDVSLSFQFDKIQCQNLFMTLNLKFDRLDYIKALPTWNTLESHYINGSYMINWSQNPFNWYQFTDNGYNDFLNLPEFSESFNISIPISDNSESILQNTYEMCIDCNKITVSLNYVFMVDQLIPINTTITKSNIDINIDGEFVGELYGDPQYSVETNNDMPTFHYVGEYSTITASRYSLVEGFLFIPLNKYKKPISLELYNHNDYNVEFEILTSI